MSVSATLMNSDRLFLSRQDFISLINLTLKKGADSFAKEATELWLKHYPGDLYIKNQLAKALISVQDYSASKKILAEILDNDPEYLDTYNDLGKITEQDRVEYLHGCMHVLGATTLSGINLPDWSITLAKSKEEYIKGNFDAAELILRKILNNDSKNILISIEHFRQIKVSKDELTQLQLVKCYHDRWPDCIQFALWLANLHIAFGEEASSVRLLHNCVVKDIGGQVPSRIWGKDHPYQTLWPKNIQIELTIPIPFEITESSNWKKKMVSVTRRSQGKESEEKFSEVLNNDIYKEGNASDFLENAKLAHPESVKGLKPVYIILSTKTGIIDKYGKRTFEVIDEYLRKLQNIVQKRPGWSSVLFYPDDVNSTRLFNIDPIEKINPWKIKLALTDLDNYLQQNKLMVGAILIIGNDDVVPYHRLPNPTEDSDFDVLSDNPYATSDKNYFVPEWLIGRLPGEKGKDAGLLLQQLRKIIAWHQTKYQNQSFIEKIAEKLRFWDRFSEFINSVFNKSKNYGYTTAVWRRSSIAVYRPIGSGNTLRVAPPFNQETIDIEKFANTSYAYFNLHGLADTPSWYGQKDVSDRTDTPDFPVALSIQNLSSSIDCPLAIFTEACYGGLVKNKNAEDSLSLKFLSNGTQALVGSTCISYGSVYPPMIGADLLAYLFWKYIKEGYSTGGALLKAKIGLVKAMTKRQGYLDGEDQKALISFVLYGDPLIHINENSNLQGNQVSSRSKLNIKTFNDHENMIIEAPRLSGEVISNVKEVLREYLPGIENAEINIKHQKVELNGLHSEGKEIKYAQHQTVNRTLLTYSKQLKIHRKVHYQFARVTLDENGHILKLAVSK